MWKYESPIGMLYIKYVPSKQRYGFFFDDTCYECCNTPQEEADNVYMRCTGCYEWDSADDPNCPADLSGWTIC